MSGVYSLTKEEIRHRLNPLNAGNRNLWQVSAGKLHTNFVFRDFITAMAFMQAVADIAEEMGHHPEWCNVYNRVSVNLITHSTGGISRLELDLAHHIDREHNKLSMHPHSKRAAQHD